MTERVVDIREISCFKLEEIELDSEQSEEEVPLNESEREYNKSINSKILLKYIECADKNKNIIQDQDVLIIMGKTGCGKSTTVHFLVGEKLEKVTVIEFEEFQDKKVKKEKTVIYAPKPLKGFAIGHKMQSKTLFINSIKSL